MAHDAPLATRKGHDFQDRETRAWVLGLGLGISRLICRRIRQPGEVPSSALSRRLANRLQWRPAQGRLSDMKANALYQAGRISLRDWQ